VTFLGGVMSDSEIRPAKIPEEQTKAVAGQAIATTMLDRVRAVPGVVGATLMQGGAPLNGSFVSVPVKLVDGRAFTDNDELRVRSVGAPYLDAMHLRLRRGRWIADRDRLGTTPVIVLDETAALRYFGGQDPIGQRVLLGYTGEHGYEREVVGIVSPMRWNGPETDPQPESFIPYPQTSHASAQLLVRVDPNAAGVVPAIQRAIRDVIPEAGAATPNFLEQNYASQLAQRRFNMVILAIFGIVAVAIAAIGIYGLMAFVVAQRRREIGVRVALGAVPSGILAMMLGRAMRLIMVGLVPGIVAAVLLERTVRGFLFNAQPHDPAVYVAVAMVFVAAGIIAAIGPARRATRVDPLVALRQD
jgi:predicted permease